MIGELTERYLHAADEALPGFVRYLYLTGSAALGAWQDGRSDIDTVVVTSRVPTDADLAALARIHAGMPERPHFDAVYLDPEAFAARPADGRAVPCVVNGEWRTGRPCGELNPVLWLTLQRYGIPVRGPAVAEIDIAVEAEDLRRYNLHNLDGYWRPLAGQARAALDGLDDHAPVDAEGVVWLALGPARLHYTLARADVIAKPAAGGYLAEILPEYAPLAGKAVRWRAGEPVSFVGTDARAAAASVDAVVDDAMLRWG